MMDMVDDISDLADEDDDGTPELVHPRLVQTPGLLDLRQVLLLRSEEKIMCIFKEEMNNVNIFTS